MLYLDTSAVTFSARRRALTAKAGTNFRIDPKDVIEIVRRRLLLILAVTGVLAGAAAYVIGQLPDVYASRALVHIEEGHVPRSFQQAGVIVPRLAQLVGLLRQEVLSLSSLRDLVKELHLYEPEPDDPGGGATGAIRRTVRRALGRLLAADPLERAHEDISIDIVSRQGQDYIEIKARARSGDLAMRTVNRILDLLAAKNRELRVRLAQGVADFIDSELTKARQRLDDAEARLERFRGERRASLPENETPALERLRALRTRTDERRAALDEAESKRAVLEIRIAAILRAPEGKEKDAERDALLAEIARVERLDLDLANEGKKPAHPDRTRVQAMLRSARGRLATLGEDGLTPGAPPTPPVVPEEARQPRATAEPVPAGGGRSGEAPPLNVAEVLAEMVGRGARTETIETVQNLFAETETLSRKLERLVRDQDQDLQEIGRLEALAGSFGPTRTEIEKLQALHDEAAKAHTAILADWEVMQKFLAAEKAGRTDQFRTIEPALAPLGAVGPNRFRLRALATAVSLAFAFGIACLVHRMRRTYRDAAEVEEHLGVPVLASLPKLPAAGEVAPADGGRPSAYSHLRLQCVGGGDEGCLFDMSEGTSWVIGRSPRAEIAVVDEGVSRVQCRILRQGDIFYLSDLGSANGTLVNGQRIGRHVLKRGDIITIGLTSLAFRYETPGEALRTTPAASEAALASGSNGTSAADAALEGPAQAVAERGGLLSSEDRDAVTRVLPPADVARACEAAASVRDRDRDPMARYVDEQFHRTRHRVLHHPTIRSVRSILVTSAIGAEGKTTVAMGIARALAGSLDHWALLVDADFRRPAVAGRLNIPAKPGLVEHIVDGVPLADVIRPTPLPKLSVIPSGGPSADPANIAASSNLRRLADEVRDRYPDRVAVFDAPPVLAASEPLSLALLVDGIVLVVRARKTPRALVQQALKSLPPGKVLGVVLTNAPFGRNERQSLASDRRVSPVP